MISFRNILQIAKNEVKHAIKTKKNDQLKHILQPSSNFMQIRDAFITQTVECNCVEYEECLHRDSSQFQIKYNECKELMNVLKLEERFSHYYMFFHSIGELVEQTVQKQILEQLFQKVKQSKKGDNVCQYFIEDAKKRDIQTFLFANLQVKLDECQQLIYEKIGVNNTLQIDDFINILHQPIFVSENFMKSFIHNKVRCIFKKYTKSLNIKDTLEWYGMVKTKIRSKTNFLKLLLEYCDSHIEKLKSDKVVVDYINENIDQFIDDMIKVYATYTFDKLLRSNDLTKHLENKRSDIIYDTQTTWSETQRCTLLQYLIANVYDPVNVEAKISIDTLKSNYLYKTLFTLLQARNFTIKCEHFTRTSVVKHYEKVNLDTNVISQVAVRTFTNCDSKTLSKQALNERIVDNNRKTENGNSIYQSIFPYCINCYHDYKDSCDKIKISKELNASNINNCKRKRIVYEDQCINPESNKGHQEEIKRLEKMLKSLNKLSLDR